MAKDVLKRLHLTKFRQGSYFHVLSDNGILLKDVDMDAQFATVVEKIRSKCEVCLLGACVLAKARVLDEITCGDVLYDAGNRANHYWMETDEYGQLKDVFGYEQCQLMEVCFERNWGYGGYTSQFKTDRDLVRAVMTNLIHNGGVFILPDEEGDE